MNLDSEVIQTLLAVTAIFKERNIALAKLQAIAEAIEWQNCELSKRIREVLKDG